MLLGTAAFRRRSGGITRSLDIVDLAGVNTASLSLDIGSYAPGRVIYGMAFQTNALASLTVDGVPMTLLAATAAGGSNCYLFAGAPTGSGAVSVVRSGSPANSLLFLFAGTGYSAAALNDWDAAGNSSNNQTPASLSLDVPANGGLIAGCRQYDTLTGVTSDPDSFSDNFCQAGWDVGLAANPAKAIGASVNVNRTLKVLFAASLIPV